MNQALNLALLVFLTLRCSLRRKLVVVNRHLSIALLPTLGKGDSNMKGESLIPKLLKATAEHEETVTHPSCRTSKSSHRQLLRYTKGNQCNRRHRAN